jgi:hypothetical protein
MTRRGIAISTLAVSPDGAVGLATGAVLLALAVASIVGCKARNEHYDAHPVIKDSWSDCWTGYLVGGRSHSEPNMKTGGYTSTSTYTLVLPDEGKVQIEAIDQIIRQRIESLADYVHEDPGVRTIKYQSGRSAGVVTWSVTPRKDGKEVEVQIDIEEKPLPRTRG